MARHEAPGIAHIPDGPSSRVAICGARLRGIPARPGSDRCMVCLDLSRRGYVDR